MAACPNLVIDRILVAADDQKRFRTVGNLFGSPLGRRQITPERMDQVNDHELIVMARDGVEVDLVDRRITDRPAGEFRGRLETSPYRPVSGKHERREVPGHRGEPSHWRRWAAANRSPINGGLNVEEDHHGRVPYELWVLSAVEIVSRTWNARS